MKNCIDYEVHLTALALGELEGDVRVDLESHLEDCASCRNTLEETRILGKTLSSVFSAESAESSDMAVQARARRGWSLVSKAAVILVTTGCAVAALQVTNSHQTPPDPKLAIVQEDTKVDSVIPLASVAPETTLSTEVPAKVVEGIELKYQSGSVHDAVEHHPEIRPEVLQLYETVPTTEPLPSPKEEQPVSPTAPSPGPLPLKTDSASESRLEEGNSKKLNMLGHVKTSDRNRFESEKSRSGAGDGLYPSPDLEGNCRPYLDPDCRPQHRTQHDGESYAGVIDNAFQDPRKHPLSTFGLDVDTASYSNIRRFIMNGQEPPVEAVRVEELINYFDYAHPQPNEGSLGVHFDIASCPWNMTHKLLRVGVKARDIDKGEVKGVNLVFLIDVSGSMQSANKLPLVKQSLEHLVYSLKGDDRVGIVVYAGDSRVHCASTPVSDRNTLLESIAALRAGGSTNGGAGIQLAYEMARKHFIKGGINRVILASDGDFNVGITNRNQLEELIRQQASSGVFLTTLGFGMGNLKDATLEMLADRGNGNYAYIDTIEEANKFLGEEGVGNLVTVAKDSKIQVEFNPGKVAAYRLIGYENRALAARDFNDDTKDAGDVGAGHEITVLYEIVPSGVLPPSMGGIDGLKYQMEVEEFKKPDHDRPSQISNSSEWLTLKLRYKDPESATSLLSSFAFAPPEKDGGLSPAMSQAAGVAAFGMLLRHSPHVGNASFKTVTDLAEAALEHAGCQKERERRIEFLSLVRRAAGLRTQGRCFAWVPVAE